MLESWQRAEVFMRVIPAASILLLLFASFTTIGRAQEATFPTDDER
jgi:hypothetical protein